MDFEAKIISNHNLDLSSLEILANDIASRLNVNVEFGDYNLVKNSHDYKALGTISKNESEIFITLYNLKNDTNSAYDYVLEFGEEAKLIYKDIISFIPPWEEQYDQVQLKHNKGELTKDSYYAGVFEELGNFGGDKVIFLKETNTGDLNIKQQDTWDKYCSRISKSEEFFTVPLENN